MGNFLIEMCHGITQGKMKYINSCVSILVITAFKYIHELCCEKDNMI